MVGTAWEILLSSHLLWIPLHAATSVAIFFSSSLFQKVTVTSLRFSDERTSHSLTVSWLCSEICCGWGEHRSPVARLDLAGDLNASCLFLAGWQFHLTAGWRHGSGYRLGWGSILDRSCSQISALVFCSVVHPVGLELDSKMLMSFGGRPLGTWQLATMPSV